MDSYRTSLPIVTPKRPAAYPEDWRNAEPPPDIEQLLPPKGAPNVLFILVDDMGFGASSTFGGPCEMPTADRLAGGGLKFTRFHTTAMCSPTRAALLTGRNHHQVGMAAVTEIATGYPGYNSMRPSQASPLARTLKLNGYNTAAFGKWHQTPVFEMSPSGPFDHWPTGEGFERFYGFLGGETDQWKPTLYNGITPIDLPDDPNYHLSEDLADRVINYAREQKSTTPEKPFFAYLAFGATHAPHHAPQIYRDRYKGRFDAGWDALREETLRRQKDLGVVTEDCELTVRPDSIPAWDDLDEDRKTVFRAMMEAYAAAATHTDDQVARIIEAFEDLGIMDNTLIFYTLGDNGASGEGGPDGTLNEWAAYNLVPESIQDMLADLDKIGTKYTFNHYSVGWAHALDTPYQWTKQIASHWGGTRNGMVVHWPKGFEAKGELRSQFTHVIDIAPTILAAAGLPEPRTVNGVDQIPLPGIDFGYAFEDAQAPERHTTQYFELLGNRGIYHEGWTACTMHAIPWSLGGDPGPFAEDDWELYAPDDYSQAHNLAEEQPDKLAMLKELFLIEAARNQVFPLDDRKVQRRDVAVAKRPDLMAGRTEQTLYPGMQQLGESAVISIMNRSYSITADVSVQDDADGVIVAQGGRFAGWSLYLHGGKPTFSYNWVSKEIYQVRGDQPLGAGRHEIRVDFDYDGGGAGKGGQARLSVDGTEVASGRLEHTCGYFYSTSDGLDIGKDSGAVVVDDYSDFEGRFTGTIEKVHIKVDAEHHDDPEGKVKGHLARQ